MTITIKNPKIYFKEWNLIYTNGTYWATTDEHVEQLNKIIELERENGNNKINYFKVGKVLVPDANGDI